MGLRSIGEMRDWLAAAPEGTTIPATVIAELLATMPDSGGGREMPHVVEATQESWRERIWEVAPDTRLSVAMVADAIGRPISSVYRLAAPSHPDPIPSARLDSRLSFRAGDLGGWLQRRARLASGQPEASAPLSLTGRRKRSAS